MSHPTRNKASVAALVSLAILLAALLAVPGVAGAHVKFRYSDFKVEVKGVQRTTEAFHHAPENECDISDNSSITEKVVFRSAPKVITFYGFANELNPRTLFKEAGKWPTAAKVTRHYTPRVVTPPPSPQCGEADGGESVEPLPDCGTKKVPNWEVSLKFDPRKKDGLHVFGGEYEEPFSHCLAPAGDLGFPYLLLDDTHDKPIVGDLPQDELFDPGIGKLIVLGRGTQKVEEPDLSAKVSIEWDVSLTRVGGVKEG